MELLSNVVNAVISAGATVFLPIIMIIVGLLVRMRLKDAINSGILMGIALISVNLVTNYMITEMSPALEAFVMSTGINLTIIDVGWPVASAITWSWPYVFLIFPICLGINFLMVAFNLTKTMNIDVWNYWGKAFTAVIVWYFSGSVIFGLVVAAIQCIIELKIGDAIAVPLQKLTGVPGVTCPHPLFFVSAIVHPIDLLLRKIPFLNKKFDADTLKEKLGFFGENHVIGFILGFLVAVVGRLSITDSIVLGIKMAACMLLFPRVTKVFMEALSPISDKASTFLREKLKGRELFIGIDWPFMAGRNEMWVATILCVPFMVLFAVITPGNNVLPLASAFTISAVICVMVSSDGNILRMILAQTIIWPAVFLMGTFIAPVLTSLAQSTGAYDFSGGVSAITFLGQEAPFFRTLWGLIASGKLLPGILILVVWSLGMWKFISDMNKKTDEIKSENEVG